ncbi:tyrosinase central domain protein [Exidia glandulosa HHB12029]|uniref:Tyrosinase central domain protein n=1 Tax=Exidia glandulosa HHB12029 TaxID=1314781 RepID=A0A165JGH2_EXIGL|nr:tyrosinase central domain protein [Exidia glandulosa HHB12029]
MKLLLTALCLVVATLARQVPTAHADYVPRVCSSSSVRVRKEWGDLALHERKAYTDAVLCLQAKPSQLDHALYNSTSRYEDFVVTHINSTRFIHNNAVFLAWHRRFAWLFERKLQQDCGYRGTLPYWDWPKNAKNLTASPLFDGSPYSLSGQGLPLSPEEKAREPPCWAGNVTCPQGPGGGCVTDGPFKRFRIGFEHIGFDPALSPEPGLPPTVFNYVPRCFSRDLNQWIGTNFQTQENLDNVLAAETIAEFQDRIDNVFGDGFRGLHPAGHAVLGSTGADFFSSPMDPAFYLHHSMIDKVWTEWQSKGHGDERIYGDNALSGTLTTFNTPPSDNATMASVINWGTLEGPLPIVKVMAVGRGDLCYRYE